MNAKNDSSNKGKFTFKAKCSPDAPRPWVCEICGFPFRRRANLLEHLRFYHLKGNVPCNHCDKTFLTASLLRKHMKDHAVENNRCPHCRTKLDNETSAYKIHLNECKRRPKQSTVSSDVSENKISNKFNGSSKRKNSATSNKNNVKSVQIQSDISFTSVEEEKKSDDSNQSLDSNFNNNNAHIQSGSNIPLNNSEATELNTTRYYLPEEPVNFLFIHWKEEPHASNQSSERENSVISNNSNVHFQSNPNIPCVDLTYSDGEENMLNDSNCVHNEEKPINNNNAPIWICIECCSQFKDDESFQQHDCISTNMYSAS